jgi:RimJ/RimL family protein N-acetyltransferase
MIFQWTDNDTSKILRIFDSFNKARAIIIPSIKQGRCKLWVDSLESPSAVLWRLRILNALAGDSDCHEASELVNKLEPPQVLIAPDQHWSGLVRKTWGAHLEIRKRTKFSPKSLEIRHLRELRDNLSEGYTTERMNLETVKTLDKRLHSYIPMFFGSSNDFYEKGIGFCIKDRGKVVSSATTFTPFIDEFETEVNTINDSKYRRKGLATAVSATLLVHALEHDLVPHWDTENEISVRLALRLGYINPEPYESFFLKSL